MPKYFKQPSENDCHQIPTATQPTPDRGLTDNGVRHPAPRDREWLLSTNEAAGLLGLSPHTLSKWRITGNGPPFQLLGRRCLYDPETLRRWAESRARRSTSDPGVEAES